MSDTKKKSGKRKKRIVTIRNVNSLHLEEKQFLSLSSTCILQTIKIGHPA